MSDVRRRTLAQVVAAARVDVARRHPRVNLVDAPAVFIAMRAPQAQALAEHREAFGDPGNLNGAAAPQKTLPVEGLSPALRAKRRKCSDGQVGSWRVPPQSVALN